MVYTQPCGMSNKEILCILRDDTFITINVAKNVFVQKLFSFGYYFRQITIYING